MGGPAISSLQLLKQFVRYYVSIHDGRDGGKVVQKTARGTLGEHYHNHSKTIPADILSEAELVVSLRHDQHFNRR